MTTTTFRLIHVSDLHIARRDNRLALRDIRALTVGGLLSSPAERNRLVALARWIASERTSGFDALVVTGDIANTGGAADLESASAYFVEIPSPGAWLANDEPCVGVAKLPGALLLPGNHDRYSGTTLPGSTRFDEVFSKYWTCGFGAQHLELSKNGSKLTIIAADFSLRERGQADGALGHFGQGIVDDERVAALSDVATGCMHVDAPAILALHFPPEFQYPKGYFVEGAMQLVNESRLLGWASDNCISLLLAGHTHIKAFYQCESQPQITVACAGTPTKESDPNWVHVVEVDVRASRIEQVRRLNYELQPPSASNVVFCDMSFRHVHTDTLDR